MPSALIFPSNVFDFIQSIDDYYMPVLTGNYQKLIRALVLLVNVFLTPVYVLLTDNPTWLVGPLSFLLPKDSYTIPLFLQFIIGGLILGDYAVQSGWFIPQSILYMAIVSLSSFVQPSVELTFALKFIRLILLVFTGLFGTWGFIAGIIISIAIVASTKTLTGESYLYPLIPFNWSALKHLLFRTKKTASKK